MLQSRTLASLADFIERHDLLAKFYILTLCLILVLPNVAPLRAMYYVVMVPMLLIVLTRQEAWELIRSPIGTFIIAYFLVFAVAAPFTEGFTAKVLIDHVRNSLLVVSFLAMTAILVRKNPQFPFYLFMFLAVTATVVGVNNIWHFYGGLPPLNRLPQRFEGVPGLTMYYNSNWIAQMYGVICVGAAAAAARPGNPRSATALLALCAAVLFTCVMLTQTRSVLIGVVAAFAVIIVLLPSQTPLHRAIQICAIAVAALASVPFIEILIARGEPYRLQFWEAYLTHVDAHPWVGAGLTAEVIAKAPDGIETNHPHNIIYHALLRGGAFAMAALVALLTAVCLQAVRAWQITGSAMYPALIVVALLPLQLEFTVVTGTAPGWDWLVLWMPIGLCVGASWLDPNRADSRFAARR